MTTSPGGHDDGLDVDEAWAAIVANWDLDAPDRETSLLGDSRDRHDLDLRSDTANTHSVSERAEREARQGGVDPSSPRHRADGPPDQAPSETDRSAAEDVEEFDPEMYPAPEAAVSDEPQAVHREPALPRHVEDVLEEHFEQPDPPLPSIKPAVVAAWTLLVVVPLLALVWSLVSDGVSNLVLMGAAASIVGGFGVLLAQLRSDDDDLDDDGAVV